MVTGQHRPESLLRVLQWQELIINHQPLRLWRVSSFLLHKHPEHDYLHCVCTSLSPGFDKCEGQRSIHNLSTAVQSKCCPRSMTGEPHLGDISFSYVTRQKPMNKTKTWWAEWDWALECLRPSCPGCTIAVVYVWIQKQINLLSSVEQVSMNPFFSVLYPFTDLLCTLFSISSFWFSEDSKIELVPLWVISLPHRHTDSFS